jgi:hypothetical protein
MLRIPQYVDNRLTDGSKVVSPTHRPRSTPQKHFSASGTHFSWRLSKPQGLVRLEGLGKLENFIHPLKGRRGIYRKVWCSTNHRNVAAMCTASHPTRSYRRLHSTYHCKNWNFACPFLSPLLSTARITRDLVFCCAQSMTPAGGTHFLFALLTQLWWALSYFCLDVRFAIAASCHHMRRNRKAASEQANCGKRSCQWRNRSAV